MSEETINAVLDRALDWVEFERNSLVVSVVREGRVKACQALEAALAAHAKSPTPPSLSQDVLMAAREVNEAELGESRHDLGIALPKLTAALAAHAAAPAEVDLMVVRAALALFRSALLSGETWSSTCEDAYEKASDALLAAPAEVDWKALCRDALPFIDPRTDAFECIEEALSEADAREKGSTHTQPMGVAGHPGNSMADWKVKR